RLLPAPLPAYARRSCRRAAAAAVPGAAAPVPVQTATAATKSPIPRRRRGPDPGCCAGLLRLETPLSFLLPTPLAFLYFFIGCCCCCCCCCCASRAPFWTPLRVLTTPVVKC
ncbi:unnamed protein product, partial [Ectocarpus sp. 12 AP-2014]